MKSKFRIEKLEKFLHKVKIDSKFRFGKLKKPKNNSLSLSKANDLIEFKTRDFLHKVFVKVEIKS